MEVFKLKYPFVYSLAWLLPVLVLYSYQLQGVTAFLPFFVYFGLIPFLELLLPASKSNFERKTEIAAKRNDWFQVLTVLCLPIHIFVLLIFLKEIQDVELWTLTWWAYVVNMGLMNGIIGINVGHELGHSNKKFESLIGQTLLLLSFNAHFHPYHNLGHHLDVATNKDPATASKNQWVYHFWISSHFGSYFKAWKLAARTMRLYSIIMVLILAFILVYAGQIALLSYLISVVVGIILLETVNYIEHYGLQRDILPNGQPERVKHQHSWNSDHIIGRLTLFNLSRHSDHHAKASIKYQNLKSLKDSPQLPTGYPGMMLLSLIPPLYFKVVNPIIPKKNV